MRQGQQNNKRMRGRGRKVTNSINRVYESNGPNVKIRGSASHIAEKYATLARDSNASGDPVAAENYMQHAEHYSRIVAAMQPAPVSYQPFMSDLVDDEDGGSDQPQRVETDQQNRMKPTFNDKTKADKSADSEDSADDEQPVVSAISSIGVNPA